MILTLAPGVRRLVYQLQWTGRTGDAATVEAVGALLRHHGLDPDRLVDGSAIAVMVTPDGVPLLECELAGDPPGRPTSTRLLCTPPQVGWWADELTELVHRRD